MFRPALFGLLVLSLARLDEASPADVCGEKRGLKIGSAIDAAHRIIGEIDSSPATICTDDQKEATRRLGQLVESQLGFDVCSLEVAKKFESFHFEYIDKKSPKRKFLPKALRNFFVTLAMRLHQHCVRQMVHSLPNDDSTLLSEVDSKRKANFVQGDREIFDKTFKQPKDYNDIVLLTDTINPEAEIFKQRRIIAGKVPGDYGLYYSSCKKTFRPIYERRVMPVYVLSRLGYGFLSKQVRMEIGEIGQHKTILDWYRLTMLCDALMFYELRNERFGLLRVVDQETELADLPKGEFEPRKPYVQMAADGQQMIEEKLFESESSGEELVKAAGKFSPRRNLLRDARKRFKSMLSPAAKSVVIKYFLKRKLFHSDKELQSVNLDRFIEELNHEVRRGPREFYLAIDFLDVFLVILWLIPVINIFPAIILAQTIKEVRQTKRLKEKSGFHINL